MQISGNVNSDTRDSVISCFVRLGFIRRGGGVTIVMTTCNVLGIIEHDFGPLKLEDWDVFKYFSIMLIRDVDTPPPHLNFFSLL